MPDPMITKSQFEISLIFSSLRLAIFTSKAFSRRILTISSAVLVVARIWCHMQLEFSFLESICIYRLS